MEPALYGVTLQYKRALSGVCIGGFERYGIFWIFSTNIQYCRIPAYQFFLTSFDIYTNDSISGTIFDRPNFNRLIADATAGKINLVLCKDLSRLGRDYIEAGKYTDIVFPSMGVRFIALNDGVDTSTRITRCWSF